MNYEELLGVGPYELDHEAKTKYLNTAIGSLTVHHYENCPEYKAIIDATMDDPENFLRDVNVGKRDYSDIPYLPVRLFKEYDLRSVDQGDVVKTMTSSGTTGQNKSKIYLDKETSRNQTKCLTTIVSDYIGKKRLPMIVLDTSAVIKDRKLFSARGAGILGFSIFARDRFFAFDENMKLDVDGMKAFLEKHEGEDIFLFGFTFMIWQHFVKELREISYKPDLSKGILIHGGGWKKLESESVSAEAFKSALYEVCSINSVHDYYGMVEQTGTIYMECEEGHMHVSSYSDVIIRRPHDFSVADIGEEGLVEVVSILPYSYPGHALLTEDRGVILGEDDCPCGRCGKYIKILGRIKNAEVRGCSDTYETRK